MIAYQVLRWNYSIRPIEVIKFTAQFVILRGGKREGLDTEYGRIFVNKPDAEECLRNRLIARIDSLRRDIAKAELALAALDSQEKVTP